MHEVIRAAITSMVKRNFIKRAYDIGVALLLNLIGQIISQRIEQSQGIKCYHGGNEQVMLCCRVSVLTCRALLGRILLCARQRSSVVEQGTHKPLVTSSNLVAATISFKSFRKVVGSHRSIAFGELT